jgi:oligoribonuclease NrnB/cAMP/cGMP phosphodiesterase (DHH superfamily)
LEELEDYTLFHLSHIDLDGYSCQFITSLIFENAYFYNSNYGQEIRIRLEEIFDDIREINPSKPIFILITDLNLSQDEAHFLENKISTLHGRKIKILLLDHHITGKGMDEKFKWYFLDENRSATQITYDYFLNKVGFKPELEKKLSKFVNAVNSVDIWKQDNKSDFEYGKVAMRLVSYSKELNRFIFKEEDNKYKSHLLNQAMEIFSTIENSPNIYLDDKIHFIKKSFFKTGEDDTFDNLLTKRVVELLGENRQKLTVYYKNYKGLLTYSMGNISIIGNKFLMNYPEFDFIVDVSSRGSISLRANNKVDVSIVAKEWANGGGHRNSSGGKIKGFREQFRYSDVKKAIEDLIKHRENHTNLLNIKK